MKRTNHMTPSKTLSILVSDRARLNAQEAQPGSAVETMLGRVRGLVSPGVIAFKGLRYCASTTGANRAQSEGQWRPRGKEDGVNLTFVTAEPISVWKKRRHHELPYRKNRGGHCLRA